MREMKIKIFEDIQAWKEERELVKEIYGGYAKITCLLSIPLILRVCVKTGLRKDTGRQWSAENYLPNRKNY